MAQTGDPTRIIRIKTVCVFEKPMIEIEHKDFDYSNTGGNNPFHGIQIDESLASKKLDILKLCNEISDKLLELHDLVNE